MRTFRVTTIDTIVVKKTYYVDINGEEYHARKFIQDLIDSSNVMELEGLEEDTNTVTDNEVIDEITETDKDGNDLQKP